MANIEELLQKQKDRIEKIASPAPSISPSRKKIVRTGATRPWQENLSQYQEQQAVQSDSPLLPIQCKASQKDHPDTTKSAPKALANREQTVSIVSPKALANREQTVSAEILESVSKKESVSNAYAEPLAGPLANREHSVSNAYAETDFEALVGKEKKLLFFVFKKCQQTGSLETSLITTEELRQLLEISSERLRNVIYRLSKKEFIEVIEIKNGRSGWRKFRLKRDLFQKLCLDASVSNALANREHSVSIASPKAYAEPLAGSPSSSSLLDLENLKLTTTSAASVQSDNDLGAKWRSIDFSSLAEIGFTETHLFQVASRGKLTPDVLRNSIDAFSFDLRNNEKAKAITGSPLNFFMGIIGKGNAYAPPPNYETPDDEALRKYLEAQEALAAKRAAKIQRVKELKFDEWYASLSEGDKIEFQLKYGIPTAIKEGPMRRGALWHKWEEEIWPEISVTIPGIVPESREEVSKLIDQSLAEARE